MSNIPITLDGLFDLMLSIVVKGKDNVQNDKNSQMEKQKPFVLLSERNCNHCERKGQRAQTCLTKGKSKISGAVLKDAYYHEQSFVTCSAVIVTTNPPLDSSSISGGQTIRYSISLLVEFMK